MQYETLLWNLADIYLLESTMKCILYPFQDNRGRHCASSLDTKLAEYPPAGLGGQGCNQHIHMTTWQK